MNHGESPTERRPLDDHAERMERARERGRENIRYAGWWGWEPEPPRAALRRTVTLGGRVVLSELRSEAGENNEAAEGEGTEETSAWLTINASALVPVQGRDAHGGPS